MTFTSGKIIFTDGRSEPILKALDYKTADYEDSTIWFKDKDTEYMTFLTNGSRCILKLYEPDKWGVTNEVKEIIINGDAINKNPPF